MPTEGYIRGKPDVGWWLTQIHAGEEFRKKVTSESDWKTWREYYRGNWRHDIMPVNIFFTMLRSQIPRIYFRDPAISVQPAKPGLLNMSFARILERVDNKLIRQMRAKRQIKKMVHDVFFAGTGFTKIGFGGLYSPSADMENTTITGRSGNVVEYGMFNADNMPWFRRVRPGNIILPPAVEEWEHMRWIAEEIVRPVEDVRDDMRLTNVKELKGSREMSIEFGAVQRPIELIKLYEVHDRKTGQVFIITPDGDGSTQPLLFEPDTFQLYKGAPYYHVVFNDDDEWVWGVPDTRILEPYQLELNEAATQIRKHRRTSLIKILAKKGSITEVEAEKMISADVAAVVWIEDGDIGDAIELTKGGTIPPEIFQSAESTMQDVRETVGFSRNQFGEFNSRSGDTTATEASIVKQATEIRIDERRDVVADMLVDSTEGIHGIIFDNWTNDDVVDVIGPGGLPIWVQFRGDVLAQGRYDVKIDPDSGIPETRALREQRALQLYQVLATNPLIDVAKLTKYLLSEMQGVQFDDMMKMLPEAEGGMPGEPVGPKDLARMIQNSFDQIGRPGASPGLLTPPTSNGNEGSNA